MAPKELRLVCPSCRARLTADVRTQTILAWQPAASGSPRAQQREGEDAWRRAHERVADLGERSRDRFEAALAKERERAGDLDEVYDEVRGAAVEDDPFEAALARVRERDAHLEDGTGADGTVAHGAQPPTGAAGAAAARRDPAEPLLTPFSDAWIRRLVAADRASLEARTRGLATWEHRRPSWGAHAIGPAVAALGPGYGSVFGVERASDDELDRVLTLAAGHPSTVAQLAPTADHAEQARRLLARGWRPDALDAVFWRDLGRAIERQPRAACVRRVRAGDLESWCRTLVRALGLSTDDDQRRAQRMAHEFEGAGWQLFLSSDDGQDVAAAALFVDGDVAVMGLAATCEDQRGRGHQKALIEARLHAAVDAGAKVAVSLPEMRGPSQSATCANGFSLAYHQSLWVPPATDS